MMEQYQTFRPPFIIFTNYTYIIFKYRQTLKKIKIQNTLTHNITFKWGTTTKKERSTCHDTDP